MKLKLKMEQSLVVPRYEAMTNSRILNTGISFFQKQKKYILVGTLALSAGIVLILLGVGVIGGSNAEPDFLSVDSPILTKGSFWEYSIRTENGKKSGLVKAILAYSNPKTREYMLGAGELEDAVEHAVLNQFPFLGRITKRN